MLRRMSNWLRASLNWPLSSYCRARSTIEFTRSRRSRTNRRDCCSWGSSGYCSTASLRMLTRLPRSRAESERDLGRRVNILKEAVEQYPEEPQLQQSLRLVRERRDLVNSIVERARQYEERGQFNEALSQFDILRNIYAQYPGIEFETERLKRRRDAQVREESKGRWVEQIDRQIALGDYSRARELARTSLAEFPEDGELAGLEQLAEGALGRAAEADQWLQRGQKLCFDRQFSEGLEALRKAASLDNRNAVVRAALLNALVEEARAVLGQDWRAAETLIEEALNIDGNQPLAKSLQGLV